MELLKECRIDAPVAVADHVFSWVGGAFALPASVDDIWLVPQELRAYDQSLSSHLEGLMKSSGDASVLRRIMSLERAAMAHGKSVPACKYLM